MDCSGEHRGFGVNISYVRSITLDSLNKNQVDVLKISGNKRLNDFLRFYGINKNISKKQLFNSKILHYYRKMVSISL
jgi:ADP-ribosylation factor GTPase-activating protein 1